MGQTIMTPLHDKPFSKKWILITVAFPCCQGRAADGKNGK